MIVIAVILSGVLPKLSAFQNAAGEVIGIPIFREVTLTVPAIIEIAIILLAALLSFKTTPKEVRVQNHFTWGAIQEVAVLFIGIFITMQPALMVLKSAGSGLGITKPFEMFWATGALSSFLDNTPTYIGNAPNFMVKSLSDENGINMPSFFGYIWWSLRYLIPVFIIDMIIFFL